MAPKSYRKGPAGGRGRVRGSNRLLVRGGFRGLLIGCADTVAVFGVVTAITVVIGIALGRVPVPGIVAGPNRVRSHGWARKIVCIDQAETNQSP